MRNSVALSLLTLLVLLTGCFTLQAKVPEGMARHYAREDGYDLGAICSYEGRSYSEGASVCMEQRRMVCQVGERWVEDGSCSS